MDTGGKEDTAIVYVVLPSSIVETVHIDDTIEYFTFFTYAPNMAWFVPLIFLLVGTVGVVVHTVYTGHCSCAKR